MSLLTKEFCAQNRIVFSPKDEAEAAYIQRRLFDMGFKWADGKCAVSYLTESVATGISLEAGKIYYNPDRAKVFVEAAAPDFPGFDADDMLSPAEKRQRAAFNAISARMDQLEAKLDRLLELMEPRKIEKFAAPKGHSL